jgi:hypothetical protein
MTSRRAAATAAVLAATLGLAAASWVIAVRQMNGMDMGVATELGSFAFFVAVSRRPVLDLDPSISSRVAGTSSRLPRWVEKIPFRGTANPLGPGQASAVWRGL